MSKATPLFGLVSQRRILQFRGFFLALDDDLEGSCNELSLVLSMLRDRWFARDFQSIKSRTFVNSSFRFHVSILQLSIFFFMIRMSSKFSPLVGICTFRSGLAKLSSLLDGEHGLGVAVLEVHSVKENKLVTIYLQLIIVNCCKNNWPSGTRKITRGNSASGLKILWFIV